MAATRAAQHRLTARWPAHDHTWPVRQAARPAGRQAGRRPWMAHWVPEALMGIGERVREAHLRHFCPGGAGFPVTSPSSAGVDLDQAPFLRRPALTLDDHMAQASGAACGRCGQRVEARQAVRRRADRTWVHENCLPPCR